MIKKFNTSVAPSAGTTTATSGGGMNKIVMAVIALGALYVGYRFIVKPMMDAKNAKQDAE